MNSHFKKTEIPDKRIFFVADIHGNQSQLEKALKYTYNEEIDLLIFGGDIAPKSRTKRTPEAQWKFFVKSFFPKISRLRKDLERNHRDCDVVAVSGNDDFKCLFRRLREEGSKHRVHFLSNHILDIGEDVQIVGYSFVPLTPFQYKDWEKIDIFDHDRTDFVSSGVVYRENTPTSVSWDYIKSRGTIYDDINKLFSKTRDNTKLTILVTHAPPFNSDLDVVNDGKHVGSKAVLNAIETFRPNVSFHGHIHESFKLTGAFSHRFKNTISFNPGNFFDSKELCGIVLNTGALNSAKRVCISENTTYMRIGKFRYVLSRLWRNGRRRKGHFQTSNSCH